MGQGRREYERGVPPAEQMDGEQSGQEDHGGTEWVFLLLYIILFLVIQGTFDPTTNYAQKLLAEQMRHEEDTLEPLITPQIKEEPGEKDNKPATSTTTPTARQAWQTARPPETRLPPVTRIVTLGFRSTKPPTKRIIPVPKLRPDVTNVNPNVC